jgi:hypothetical protein
MAVALSGGLLTSTALGLLAVPVVFSLLSDFEHWIKRQFGSGQIRTLWQWRADIDRRGEQQPHSSSVKGKSRG